MAKYAMIIFVSTLMLTAVICKPADKNELDKATENDDIVNSVNPDKLNFKVEDNKKIIEASGNTPGGAFQTSVSFGTPVSNIAKPGVHVARIIDDIFQIPIGVLQSVSRLLRNPFLPHKTPETVSSY